MRGVVIQLRSIRVVVTCVIAVICACDGDDSRLSEHQALREVHHFLQSAGEAVNHGDVEAEVSRFTRDGVYMWPDGPSIVGRDSLRAWFERRFSRVDVELSAQTQEVRVLGEWAFERGTYVAFIKPKGTAVVDTVRGKHLNILQRQPDGTWKIARRMRNRDRPLRQP
jgi:uncharacterized protein (TIGR02246 family)